MLTFDFLYFYVWVLSVNIKSCVYMSECVLECFICNKEELSKYAKEI